MISETIRALVNEGRTTCKELAELAGISDSAVSRYMTDQCGPTFHTVMLWVKHHRDPVVRQAFTDCLLAGTGAHVMWPTQPIETDLNGDGKTDGADAMLAVATLLERMSASASLLLGALGQGPITDEQNAAMLRARQALARANDTVSEVVTIMAQDAPPRRKAHIPDYMRLHVNGRAG